MTIGADHREHGHAVVIGSLVSRSPLAPAGD
jgi:hypothetical protein